MDDHFQHAQEARDVILESDRVSMLTEGQKAELTRRLAELRADPGSA